MRNRSFNIFAIHLEGDRDLTQGGVGLRRSMTPLQGFRIESADSQGVALGNRTPPLQGFRIETAEFPGPVPGGQQLA